MRVLDALNFIAENQAGDLAYRWFCGSKMCGTCAVRMNGREVLACWEAVEPEMTIEPLRNLPVVRDLVVDRAPFERKVAELEPWIERRRALCGLSRAALAQGHEERLEGARLHRLHVLLLGLPGDRPRRSDRFRRPGAAGPARPDRARSAQRPRQGRPLARAHRHLPLRVLLQVRGGLPGQHSDRQPRDRAVESEGGGAGPGMAKHPQMLARDRRRARPRRSERARAARAGTCGAAQPAAGAAAAAARQDRPDQDVPADQDAGAPPRGPPAWPARRSRP